MRACLPGRARAVNSILGALALRPLTACVAARESVARDGCLICKA